MTLEQFLTSKMPEDKWKSAIDESIAACAAFERRMDDFPAGVNIRDAELEQLSKRREAAIRNLESLWHRQRDTGTSST